MTLLLLFSGVLYLIMIFLLIIGFEKVKSSECRKEEDPSGFSIVIPFRNEEARLPTLLKSISRLSYPRDCFEVILVDDESEDNSLQLCRNFSIDFPQINIRLLNSERSSGSPKKDAINAGIQASNYAYIITTDADCKIPKNWLWCFSSETRKTGAKMIAGPVGFQEPVRKSFFQKLEGLDFLSLQATGMGAFGLGRPFLCNGANLCYSKSTFYEVGGFNDNLHLASGDDVFLLQNFRAKGFKVSFLKNPEAIVRTNYQERVKELFFQRIRWGAKTTSYRDIIAKLMGLIVLLFNSILIISAFLALLEKLDSDLLMFIFLLKFNFDFVLLYKTAKFFQRERRMKDYFWVSVVHPFFITITSLMSLFKSFEWKGRSFRK